MTDPPLTTVHQPTYELGATAYELLGAARRPSSGSFSPHLVERQSTGRGASPWPSSRTSAVARHVLAEHEHTFFEAGPVVVEIDDEAVAPGSDVLRRAVRPPTPAGAIA